MSQKVHQNFGKFYVAQSWSGGFAERIKVEFLIWVWRIFGELPATFSAHSSANVSPQFFRLVSPGFQAPPPKNFTPKIHAKSRRHSSPFPDFWTNMFSRRYSAYRETDQTYLTALNETQAVKCACSPSNIACAMWFHRFSEGREWGVRSVVVEFGAFGAPPFSVQRFPNPLKIGIWGPLDWKSGRPKNAKSYHDGSDPPFAALWVSQLGGFEESGAVCRRQMCMPEGRKTREDQTWLRLWFCSHISEVCSNNLPGLNVGGVPKEGADWLVYDDLSKREAPNLRKTVSILKGAAALFVETFSCEIKGRDGSWTSTADNLQ